ncbi:MAG: RNA polymerase sigma factor [Deltaproteobacteria bacterium]|nr:RNA polymerase sigma factor [Deltaproteobacteria bacterium]
MTLPGPEAASRAQAATGEVELTVERLYRAHFAMVYRVVGRSLGPGASPADLEDLTQLTFLQAHRGLASFRGDCKPSTWLCGIAMRTTLQWMRGRGRRRRLREALALELQAETRQSAADAPERSAASRDRLRKVWEVLLSMKEGKRAVYVLHELEGMPGPEIARALRIPEGTVWTRLHHARKEILAALPPDEEVSR